MTSPTEIVGPYPPGADPDAYDRLRRRVLWKMPTGLYLIGSVSGEERNLMTASLVSQVCVDPKLVGAAVERSSRTHELIEKGECFALAMIARADRTIVRKFVKPADDDRGAMTLNGFEYFDGPITGAPVLSSSVAYVECRLERALALGSHTWFIGEVVDASFGPDASEDDEVLRVEDTRMNYGG